MALCLVCFALVFHALERRLAGRAAAFIATTLVVTVPGAAVPAERTGKVLGGVPGAFLVSGLLVWQVTVLSWLGPAAFAENYLALREMSAGAAFVFDTTIARRSASPIVDASGYFGPARPALFYVGWRSLHRTTRKQQWDVVWLVAAANLAWFVFASTGWVRYASHGLVLAALCVARFARDQLRAIARRPGPSRDSDRVWRSQSGSGCSPRWRAARAGRDRPRFDTA